MKCFKCGSEARFIVPSLQKPACDKCYSRIIEKRLWKRVKGLRSVKLLFNRGSDYVLKFLLEKRGIRVTRGGVTQFTIDDYCVRGLRSFFFNKDYFIRRESLLDLITEEELINYSLINNLGFRGNKRSGVELLIHDFIMKLNERRPGVLFSIKSYLEQF